MKKYKLKFGEEISDFYKNKFGDITIDSECFADEKFLYCETDTLYGFCQKGSVFYKRRKIAFTEEEIDNLPHGIMKHAELIEVEEELYNIIYPYTEEYFVEFLKSSVNKWWTADSGENEFCLKKQFTMQEIKERYPKLAKWAKKYGK